jgi:hypothetical protein
MEAVMLEFFYLNESIINLVTSLTFLSGAFVSDADKDLSEETVPRKIYFSIVLIAFLILTFSILVNALHKGF